MKMKEIQQTEAIAVQGKRKPDQNTKTAVIKTISDVEREEVDWLWIDRIPKGKITIIEGDPGTGKSWLTMVLATAITLGTPLPGQEEGKPANVLLLTAEDGLSDTIRPRLEDMGADLTRVKAMEAVKQQDKERHFSLADDIDVLDAVLANGEYALVVIDPINAYLDASIDTHKDAALRFVLTPLAKLAERHGVAVVCVRHLNKGSGTKAIYRGIGSIAYTAAARVVHLVGVNPDNQNERAIICTKNNLAPLPPALAFNITDKQFFWRGETSLTAERILDSDMKQGEASALDEATGFLQEALADRSQQVASIIKDAKGAGISETTLKRAKSNLGIKASKEGFGDQGYWVWSLPGVFNDAKEVKTQQGVNLTLLGKKDHQHEYAKVSNAVGTFVRCKNCGEFPPKSSANN